jgi:pilus assembly protein FimV
VATQNSFQATINSSSTSAPTPVKAEPVYYQPTTAERVAADNWTNNVTPPKAKGNRTTPPNWVVPPNKQSGAAHDQPKPAHPQPAEEPASAYSGLLRRLNRNSPTNLNMPMADSPVVPKEAPREPAKAAPKEAPKEPAPATKEAAPANAKPAKAAPKKPAPPPPPPPPPAVGSDDITGRLLRAKQRIKEERSKSDTESE